MSADDDDIAATMQALTQKAGPAPASDDDDIAATINALRRPAADAAPQTPQASGAPYQKTPLADRIAYAESRNDPNAHAAGSTAGGLGQFIDKTWVGLLKKYRPDVTAGKSDQDLLAMKADPDLNKQMINANIEENTHALTAAGIPVNDATLYGAHWFGPEKYREIYNADPMTPIEDIIGKDAAATNRLAGRTTDDAITKAANAVGLDHAGKDYTAGETIRLAGHNAAPSLLKTAKGIGSAVIHPIDTLKTIGELGDGLLSKAESYADIDQDPDKKAQREALIDALADSYREKYGSINGFQNALAHDPTGVAMDVSTVASGGAGVLGGAAKLASKAGLAGVGAGLGSAAHVASKVATVTNPLSVLTAVVPAAAPQVVDRAGNLTPKVDDLVQKATGGSMRAADIRDPATKDVFVKTLQKKGVSLAAVKEALLKSLDPEMKAPTPIVTGEMKHRSASEHVKQAVADNNEIISNLADQFGGTSAPADVGAALDAAHTASINRASNLYERIRTMPGTFGRAMPDMQGLAQRIQQNWTRSGIPNASMDALAADHPYSAAAVSRLRDFWGQGRTLTRGGQFNGTEILEMRKALNGLRDSAQGSDVKGVSDVIDAFDKHIASLSRRGYFVDPATGNPVTNLADTIQAANKAYRHHFNTYETMNGQNNAIVSATRALKTAQGRAPGGQKMPSGDAGLYTKVMGPMGKALMDPAKGANTYDSLMRATGNSPSVAGLVKNQLMDPLGPPKMPANVGKPKTPANIAASLSDPNSAAAKALTPGELSRARHIHAASVLNNTQPSFTSRLSSIAGNVASRALMRGAAAYLGSNVSDLTGAIAGYTAERMREGVADRLHASAVMKGAPAQSRIKKAAKFLAKPNVLKNIGTGLHYTQDRSIQTQPPIARASGGKVDDDMLVKRLTKRWKAAKRATDETTKPLLNVPDNAIIRALDIAQEHL